MTEKANRPKVPFPGLRSYLAQKHYDEENQHSCWPGRRFMAEQLPLFNPRNLFDMDKTPWPGE